MYWAWRASDWKNLPEPGGLLDQDKTLQQDLLTYHQLYSAEEDKLDDKKKQRPARHEPVVLYNNLAEEKKGKRRK